MNRKWTLNQQVYRQKKLLGHGKGGYSYLVSDSEGYLFVLKQIHHEPCSYYQFGDKMESELTSYSKLINADIMVPRLIAFDREEEIVLKEYVPGETIDHLVANGPLDPGILRQIKDMAKKAVDHGFNLDYYPTNFIFYEGYLYYIDYECNNYEDKWSFDAWGKLYWSKTPEFLQAFNYR
jgi:TP53 regulating kinase-like protein